MQKTQLKRGQTTLEYIIIFTAIIGVILLVAAPALKTKIKTTLGNVDTTMSDAAEKIAPKK